MAASETEGKADLLVVKAYKERSSVRARIDYLKQAAVGYQESCDTYRRASMPMFSKASRNKCSEVLEAVDFETKHRGVENPKLKEIIGRLIRSKDFRARLGVSAGLKA
jgi:hypothetical protein